MFLTAVLLPFGLVSIVVADQVTDNAIAIHNTLRAKHGVGPLTSNDTLIAGSQNWVNKRLAGAKGHSQTKGVGENIHWQAATKPSTPDAVVTKGVNNWYSEIKNYNWWNPGDDSGGTIGHFTQVVWKASHQIGCAVGSGPYNGKFKGTEYYLVCQYYPQGNFHMKGHMAEAYSANVPPPTG